jgi:molybdopterin/thiamine biosynthesis adenylyltransferase
MQNRAVIIGLGGVGSWLLQGLTPFLSYQKDESWTLVLVDGDTYELQNQSRQMFTELGPKAEVQTKWIAMKHPKLMVTPIHAYISADGAKDSLPINQVIQSGDIVFSCVDNHKTRKVISRHCTSLRDVILISGGNEFSDGNLQVFIRKDNENQTCTIEKYHPEIAKPKDKAPHEMSCDEAAKSSPQLIIANMMVSNLMMSVFYGIREGKFDPEQSEIYFDLLVNKVVPRVRAK